MDRYEEALERAKKGLPIDEVFPELKGSEDERIRKFLLEYAIEMIAGLESDISLSTYDGIKGHDPDAEAELNQWQKARAYLEKQKENPKSADSIPSNCVSDVKWVDTIITRAIVALSDDVDYNRDEPCKYRLEIADLKKLRDVLCGQKEQNPGDKDRYMEGYMNGMNDALKERQPAEWSEEDELMREAILETLERVGDYGTIGMQKDWLKSLRPHWKPSEEQMNALWGATEKYLESDNEKVREIRGKVLESLYNDLEKQMEE